jgi:transcriptional regulator with XRE-family HTH domain
MTDDRLAELGRFISGQRQRAQLSVRKLSELAGVSNPYLSQIERGLRKPSAEILQSLAKALSISAETLYVQAGMLDEESPRAHVDVPGEIGRDPDLTDEQRATLLHIYESFRTANAATNTANAATGTVKAAPAESAPPREG